MKTFLFSFAICLAYSLSAQIPFFPGQLQLINGEKHYGELFRQIEAHGTETILFRPSPDDPIIAYAAEDVQRYITEDGQVFDRILIYTSLDSKATRQVFAQCLIRGVFSLFEFSDNLTDFQLLIMPEQNQVAFRLVTTAFATDSEGPYSKKYESRYKILNQFFQACPEVAKKVETTKNLPKKRLLRILREYHQCVGQPYQQLYELEKKPPKVLLGVKGGGNLLLGANQLLNPFFVAYLPKTGGKPAFQTSGYVGISLPRFGYKFSIIAEAEYVEHMWRQNNHVEVVPFHSTYLHLPVYIRKERFFAKSSFYAYVGLSTSIWYQQNVEYQTIQLNPRFFRLPTSIAPPRSSGIIGAGVSWNLPENLKLFVDARFIFPSWQIVQLNVGVEFGRIPK